jgi:hypothetical protein
MIIYQTGPVESVSGAFDELQYRTVLEPSVYSDEQLTRTKHLFDILSTKHQQGTDESADALAELLDAIPVESEGERVAFARQVRTERVRYEYHRYLSVAFAARLAVVLSLESYRALIEAMFDTGAVCHDPIPGVLEWTETVRSEVSETMEDRVVPNLFEPFVVPFLDRLLFNVRGTDQTFRAFGPLGPFCDAWLGEALANHPFDTAHWLRDVPDDCRGWARGALGGDVDVRYLVAHGIDPADWVVLEPILGVWDVDVETWLEMAMGPDDPVFDAEPEWFDADEPAV